MLASKRILLIIGGGIAAFKALDLIRRLRERGADVTPVLTRAGEEFVTPLSVSALAGRKVFRDLFDLTDEAEMGHIELSRSADLIVVAPATADLMAKMVGGLANDLASTLLLATDTPVLIAPAMNVRMWQHPATQRNIATLRADGIGSVGPDEGDMACGEHGPGRMAEVPRIVAATASTIRGTSAMRPGPCSPQAMSPSSGPTNPIPSALSVAILRCVAGCCHIRTFIAGASSTGVSVASRSVEARSSARPCAILAIRSAVAGATTIRSAERLSSICPISASSVRSKRSENTLRPASAETESGVTNSAPARVSTGTTSAPRSRRRRIRSSAL